MKAMGATHSHHPGQRRPESLLAWAATPLLQTFSFLLVSTRKGNDIN